MRFGIPHPIPYQGSKRLLAPAILSFVPKNRFKRLIEPFAGSAAVTLAAAHNQMFEEYVIADLLKPLTGIWQEILWLGQGGQTGRFTGFPQRSATPGVRRQPCTARYQKTPRLSPLPHRAQDSGGRASVSRLIAELVEQHRKRN